MLKDSLLNGTPLPDGLIVGPDGKIQRCKADITARTGVRGASRETNHKKVYFTGYMATTAAASLDLRDHPDPEKVPPEESIGPYILSFSLDPATINRAPVGRDVVLSLQKALPDLNIISADREFTVRPRFVQPVHEADIAIVMDYPEPYTKKTDLVTVGRRGERLLQSCGDFFPLWTPQRFLHPPSPGLTQEQLYDWYEERAKFRYVPNGPSRNGTIPAGAGRACAGNVRRSQHQSGPLQEPPPPQGCAVPGSAVRSDVVLHRFHQHPPRRLEPVAARAVGNPKPRCLLPLGQVAHREHQRPRQEGRSDAPGGVCSVRHPSAQHGGARCLSRQQRGLRCRGPAQRPTTDRYAGSAAVVVLRDHGVAQQRQRNRERHRQRHR